MPSQSVSRRSSSHQTATTSQHDAAAVAPSLADDPKYAIATTFLATMLHEVVIDTALLTHAQVKRQRRTEGKIAGGCPVCKTSCQKPIDEKQTAAGQDRAIKMETGEDVSASPVQTQESTPPLAKGLEMYQNNPLLACLVCSRQVSANRYAQHLASCVGVGKGGVARRKGKIALSSAKDRSKIKTALENRKKANFQTQSNRNTPTPTSRPEQESVSGASDDDSGSRKTKTLADTLGLNGNGKRTLSPSRDSSKRAKHNTLSRNDSRVPSSLGLSLPVTGSPLNPHRSSSKVTPAIDDDEDEDEGEGEDDDDAEEEEDEDDDVDDDDDDDDDASVALATGINRQIRNDSIAESFEDSDEARSEAVSDTASFASKKKSNPSNINTNIVSTIERSKGSDGEYIDVESASAHSEVDDDF